jgi:transposase-like protein
VDGQIVVRIPDEDYAMNVKNAIRPENMVCPSCGCKNFQTVERAAGQSFVCKDCRKTYKRKSTSGSGQIAGKVYYRTQDI